MNVGYALMKHAVYAAEQGFSVLVVAVSEKHSAELCRHLRHILNGKDHLNERITLQAGAADLPQSDLQVFPMRMRSDVVLVCPEVWDAAGVAPVESWK